MKRKLLYRKMLSMLLLLVMLLLSVSSCQKKPDGHTGEDPNMNVPQIPNEQPTPSPKPLYTRTGNTTDFVTSLTDLDAMLERPYVGDVPTAFSEGVFALHSNGWGFDNNSLFTTGNETGLGMPIRLTVNGEEIAADSAVWRPSHVRSVYSSTKTEEQLASSNIAPTATVSASYTSVYDTEGLVHLTDGIISYSATPRNRWTNYVNPPRTGAESLTLDFGCESRVHAVTLHLFDDGGATCLPAAIEVQYEVNGSFQAIPAQSCAAIERSTGVDVTFPEIRTEKIRILLTPQSGKATGVTELAVIGYNEKVHTLPAGLVVEETKFVTAEDVAMSILTFKNEGERAMEIVASAMPSIGFSEYRHGARYVRFGGKGLSQDSGIRSLTLDAGESVELRFALAFSGAAGKNTAKLQAHLSDVACLSHHAQAFTTWFEKNVPYFDCDNAEILQTYYFRWLTYRNHIRMIEDEWDGYIISEFLPNVKWSGIYNSINCPANHHFYEGRWIRDTKYLDDYQEFWFIEGANPRLYSFAIADAYYNRYLVSGDRDELVSYLALLDANYAAWESDHFDASTGLFFQKCDRDGMENSVGGDGLRPTINSYMYGDAIAIARIARMVGDVTMAETYEKKAADLKARMMDVLWNARDGFFETARQSSGTSVFVRELVGFVPWYYNLPDDEAIYAAAFAQLLDEEGFLAPYGPTTVEQRSSDFLQKVFGYGCRWDGPSWPYATAQTLVAAANLLNNYRNNDVFGKGNWLDMLTTYAKSQYKDGYSWVGEDLHPITGEWIVDLPRSVHYNHSSFADLVITGLCGIRPSDSDETLSVNPLVGEGDLSYFVLENVSYRGHNVTVLYDKDGSRYGVGAGLKVMVDGYLMAESETLCALTVSLVTPQE